MGMGIQVGDHVRWVGTHARAMNGAGVREITGRARSIKGAYAVIAAAPYGQIYMPPLKALEKIAEPEGSASK